MDFLKDILTLHRSSSEGEDIFFRGADFPNAFQQIPINPQAQRFTATLVNGTNYFIKVLVFGSASSPAAWGRFSDAAKQAT